MITVIIPTYNREKILLGAVESVLNQSYKDLELIIVDDASTDNTADLVSNIKDKRVRYIRQRNNSGACAARNTGIDVAQGEYIAFQDSDDRWHEDKLEKEIAFLQTEGADIIFCATERYSGEKITPMRIPGNNASALMKSENLYRCLLKENHVPMVTVLCKRECAEEIKLDESLPRLQDWDWALRACQIYKTCYLNEVLVDTYEQADSITCSSKKLMQALPIIFEKNRTTIESDPELEAIWASRMAYALFWAGKPARAQCLKAYKTTGEFKHLTKYILCNLGLQKVLVSLKKK